MFWIGLIVGIVLTIAVGASFAWYVVTHVYASYDEFEDLCGTIYTAIENRECDLRVYKDGEILDVTTLEEL